MKVLHLSVTYYDRLTKTMDGVERLSSVFAPCSCFVFINYPSSSLCFLCSLSLLQAWEMGHDERQRGEGTHLAIQTNRLSKQFWVGFFLPLSSSIASPSQRGLDNPGYHIKLMQRTHITVIATRMDFFQLRRGDAGPCLLTSMFELLS